MKFGFFLGTGAGAGVVDGGGGLGVEHLVGTFGGGAFGIDAFAAASGTSGGGGGWAIHLFATGGGGVRALVAGLGLGVMCGYFRSRFCVVAASNCEASLNSLGPLVLLARAQRSLNSSVKSG